jgi:steroid delta-isomerase-like uncharacterized protein
MQTESERLIRDYYRRFNAGDIDGMLALLTEDVAHDVSQGKRRRGKAAFRRFLRHMDRRYRERVRELIVMAAPGGRRMAAEFDLHGQYFKTDGRLPKATGQRYRLVVGAFFDVRRGKIARVSTHYNLNEWLRQIARK